jgi:hypothetical protein
MAAYPDLLIWWSGTITAGILFLVLVSIVLYYTSRKNREYENNLIDRVIAVVKDFAFVWVLMTLLSLYIISIDGNNYILFAVGNIVVELSIFLYLLKRKKS